MKFSFLNRLFLSLVLLLAGTNSWQQEENTIAHNLAAMRIIGHQILLNSGDSVSRVLPIEQDGDSYQISFENAFSFDPGVLSASVDSVMSIKRIAFNYRVEVEECQTDVITYSYEAGLHAQPGQGVCAGRFYPESCYQIVITLLDIPILADATAENNESNSLILFWILGALGLIFILSLAYIKNRNGQKKSDVIMIGKYRFDKKRLKLSAANEEIDLTSKEADLLDLLYSSANSTIEREAILNVVWEDQGVYVGRTLDVFISKLRKKLQADATIKILNIRGVGYKLVLQAD